MNEIWNLIRSVPGQPLDLQATLIALVASYLLSQIFAWVYILTHRGVSYSQSFVQSLVLLAVVVALIMQAVGTSIVIAFGLFGALAIIRFRNILKDTRDTAFLFMMIAIGMCAGTGNVPLATLGTVFFVMIVLLFHFSRFGARQNFDGFLTFHLAGYAEQIGTVEDLLVRHCLRKRILTQRTETDGVAYTLRLLMRDPARAPELVDDLKQCQGISGISLLLQEEESEI